MWPVDRRPDKFYGIKKGKDIYIEQAVYTSRNQHSPVNMSESPTISKREQKRQARLARELAEKAAGGSAEPTANGNDGVLTILDETSNPQLEQGAVKSSPYVEPIQRRIRTFLKKKQKIDQLTERSKDPEELKKLNADQLDILARQDAVLAPLKELQNLAEQVTLIDRQQSQATAEEKSTHESTQAEAVARAREEGLQEGKKILASLISFLGYASILRANPSPDKDFNEANEKLLTLVYAGGEESAQAATLLDSGSDDVIEGTEITYKRVHKAIFGGPEPEPETPEQSVEEPKTNGMTPHFVTLSEIAANPSPISGGISFLNESEIEGVHAPEERESPPQQNSVPGPSQGIVTQEGNKEGNAAVDWNAKSTTNWADESSDALQPETPAPAPASTQRATGQATMPRKKAQENRSDDFKTIEGRQRPGRGRGTERGRV